MPDQTLLVVLAHPDDEVGVAGTILAQRARGDRVVLLWLTRGEMTEAFGPLPSEEVARMREEQGRRAGEILDAEVRFLTYPDTALQPGPEPAREVARVIAEVRPTGLLTWGQGWVRGIRHPDHQACGQIARDAVTLARMAKVVHPLPPHRGAVPVFTLRDVHSALPRVAIDVEPYRETIHALARFYAERVGFGDAAWLDERLRSAGRSVGLRYAEELDAWETEPGVMDRLLPASPLPGLQHPDRADGHAPQAHGR